MWKNRYTCEYCYSLEEVLNTYSPTDAFDNVSSFKALFGDKLTLDNTYWTSGNGSKLWQMIYERFFDDICVITSAKINDWNSMKEAAFKDLGRWVYSIWNRTKTKYDKLATLYQSEQNDLLGKISTTRNDINRFLDVAENAEDFIDDNKYATNITKNEGTVTQDAGTILQRLDEVRKLYYDVIARWVDEFESLFISHLNYEECDD